MNTIFGKEGRTKQKHHTQKALHSITPHQALTASCGTLSPTQSAAVATIRQQFRTGTTLPKKTEA